MKKTAVIVVGTNVYEVSEEIINNKGLGILRPKKEGEPFLRPGDTEDWVIKNGKIIFL